MTEGQNTIAWAVPVRTERVETDRLTPVLYAVLASSQDNAISLVKVRLGSASDDDIGEIVQLSSETAQSLDLQPGEVRML